MVKRMFAILVCVLLVLTAAYADGVPAFKLLEGTEMETGVYVNSSGKAGETVLVVGGLHGDEPSGIAAAVELSQHVPAQGILIVIPKAYAPSCAVSRRTGNDMEDINRSFPGNSAGTPAQRTAFSIYSVIREYKPSLVIDLHESRAMYGEDESDLGQSIIFSGEGKSAELVLDTLDEINSGIEEKYRFTFASGAPGGSLNREASEDLGIPAVTVETCMEQELEQRVKQQLRVVKVLLQYLRLEQQ